MQQKKSSNTVQNYNGKLTETRYSWTMGWKPCIHSGDWIRYSVQNSLKRTNYENRHLKKARRHNSQNIVRWKKTLKEGIMAKTLWDNNEDEENNYLLS